MSESILSDSSILTLRGGAVEWAARRAHDRSGRLTLISIVGGAVGAVGEGEMLRAALSSTETPTKTRTVQVMIG